MAEGIKILMMGGQRVGKSSALAAVMDAFVNGKGKDVFSAGDVTTLATVGGKSQESITSKLAQAKAMLQSNVGKVVMVDYGKTSIKWDYTLELTLAGKSDSMKLTFTDINGEFFEGGNMQQDAVIDLVKEYDVFIVAVDCTYLMEARNDDNELVDPVIHNKYNCVDSIHTFLTHINDNDGKNAKLVIFVPVKCEKWAKEGRLEQVAQAIREDYATTLKALDKYKSVQIEILPIQTIGSMVFAEHLEAKLLNRSNSANTRTTSKCSMLPDGRVRTSDGAVLPPAAGSLSDDFEAVLIPGTDIVRPNSWFLVESSEYKPHNCEQLAYHILEFMLAKVIDAKLQEEENEDFLTKSFKFAVKVVDYMINKYTFGLWLKVKGWFGEISIDDMLEALAKIRSQKLLKYSGEGIATIKTCNFRH